MVLQRALLFISDYHPSAPLGALPKALLLHLMHSLRFTALRPWTLYLASRSCVCKVSIAPLSAFHNARRGSSAHHPVTARPQCGFWMELNTQGVD